MEESSEIWKGYIIVRQGHNWAVRNCNHYVGGTFTELSKARAWIDAELVRIRENTYRRELVRIRKIKDLKQRSKEYKELCQTLGYSLPHS